MGPFYCFAFVAIIPRSSGSMQSCVHQRCTQGLLTRLHTQVERVLGVNDAQVISVEIVEAARDSLAIGQA
jgi:hypothetical protein